MSQSDSATTTASRSAFGGHSALWASAMVILAMIIVQAGRAGAAGLPADVIAADDFTLLTASGGNDDLILILDSRSEKLYVYHVEQQSRVVQESIQNVGALFNDAKRLGPGRPR